MIAKSVLFFTIILLVKEATCLNCYQCLDANMDECNENMISVTCRSGLDRCFKFSGSAKNELGEFQPYAEKGCGYSEICKVISYQEELRTEECSVCRRNECNSSSLITSTPLLVVVLFAISSKLLG